MDTQHDRVRFSWGPSLLADTAHALRAGDSDAVQDDPVGLRLMGFFSVWGHWVGCALFLFEVSHHISDETAKYSIYLLFLLTLMAFNGLLHRRLLTNRTTTWLWLRVLYAMDIFYVSYWSATSGGFDHPFIHLFYYPVLAAVSVFLTPFWHTVALVTMVAAAYTGIALIAGDGIDFAANDHETLLARILVMFVVVATINMAATFERMRRERAIEREHALERERVELAQTLQQERIDLSHTIHDTAAQSAYVIGLGIDTALAQAGDANPKLIATLEAISQLSRSTLWDLRHPINLGGIYEGRELGSALRSHGTSFTNVSGVPAEVTQTGEEPPLSAETKSRLFAIAHNALTNAFRHSKASRVAVELAFGEEGIRLSVSDDGAGLPDDYKDLGSGFASMTSAAENLGGRLIVEKRGPMGGASVTCAVPTKRRGSQA